MGILHTKADENPGDFRPSEARFGGVESLPRAKSKHLHPVNLRQARQS
jgi:hypothetical protein